MYCAIFAKDTQIYKDELVKLWMAQGFLGSGGNLEEKGCVYFDDLAMHSFFQDFKKDPKGNITSCKMHDLVHDFALFLTKEEYTFLEDDKNVLSKKVRHLVTYRVMSSSSIYTAEKLRTLMITGYLNPDQLIKVFNQLKYIRILKLEGCRIRELPRQVEKLLHLRYLNLSRTELKELPETICYLYNLQTLNLNWCTELIKLPTGIGNLLNLRHLELEGTYNLRCIPQGIGRLRYLRTLSKFIVGDASNGCNISELKDLCSLQGSLEIFGLNQVADASEAAQAELKSKSVVSLSLCFRNREEDDSENMAVVLENLEPNKKVEELEIYGFGGSRLPSWISNGSMLASLLRLTLSICHNITELPALGNLTSLEEQALRGMKSVRLIGREFYGSGVPFPKLRKLEVDDMEELVELELPVLKSLQKLILKNCPKLRALPPGLGKLESLESLKIKKLPQVNYLGQEIYGFDDNDTSNPGVMAVAFPQLKVLKITDLDQLVKWELPSSGDNKTIMPYLSELKLSKCPMLRTLPGLGTLESLESLSISILPMIKQVGLEFWGISAATAADEFGGYSIQERVINGGGVGEEEGEEPIIPNPKTTLRTLCSSSFSRIKCLGLAFLGIAQSKGSEERRGGSSSSYVRKPVILFPKLTQLDFACMDELEVWILPPFQEYRQIMPCLSELRFSECRKLSGLVELELEEREGDISFSCLFKLDISDCTNLRVIPSYLFPHTLRKLEITNCPQLRGVQPCLPKLLESLILEGDVGVFSESLPIGEEENNNYPNLIQIKIYGSDQPSLPKGFNHLTAIQDLVFFQCEFLDFDLNELKRLTMLQKLDIDGSPIITKCFESPEDDWMSILDHVPNIQINNDYVKFKGNRIEGLDAAEQWKLRNSTA